jgi:hypothetical protein
MTLSVISLSGCIEEKNEYYVNPDGSGKVVREVLSVGGGGINFGGNETEPDTATQLKELTRDALQNAKGIETWADVTAKVSDDGKLHFKGTAYFKDITKVSFEQENMSTGSGIVFSRNNGLLTMELKDDADEEAPSPPTNLTAEQISEQIKQQRLKYNQSKPLIEGILANLKQTTIVHYNGTLKESVNFMSIQGQNALTLTFEGKKLLEYMDRMMADDKKMEQMIRAGKTMNDSDFEGFFEYLGGQPKKPRAVIVPGKPLFDYEKEVQKATADYPAMEKTLNLPAAATVETKTVEYVPGMDVRDLRVGGVRIIYFEDKSIDYRPFYQFKGYELSMVGKLPATGLQINEGQLTKATTLSGGDLLPKQEFDRSLSFLEVADDGMSVSFNAKMQVPGENEKGMAEIAGVLKCFKSSGIKTIDLGLMELKAGAKNDAEGISIKKAGKADWGDKYMIDLRMKILKHTLKDIQLFAEDGTQIETDISSGSSSNGFWLNRAIQSKSPLPAKGRIVLELYDGLEEYEIPFSLKNISLAGKPLK